MSPDLLKLQLDRVFLWIWCFFFPGRGGGVETIKKRTSLLTSTIPRHQKKKEKSNTQVAFYPNTWMPFGAGLKFSDDKHEGKLQKKKKNEASVSSGRLAEPHAKPAAGNPPAHPCAGRLCSTAHPAGGTGRAPAALAQDAVPTSLLTGTSSLPGRAPRWAGRAGPGRAGRKTPLRRS